MTEINEQVVEAIEQMANKDADSERKRRGDVFYPSEAYGNNMDDAYSGGTRDGKIFFARKLKRMMED